MTVSARVQIMGINHERETRSSSPGSYLELEEFILRCIHYIADLRDRKGQRQMFKVKAFMLLINVSDTATSHTVLGA